MPDPIQDRRFYPEARPVTASAVAELARGELVRGDGDTVAMEVATPDSAGKGRICFVASKAAAAEIPDTGGFICLAPPELAGTIPGSGCVVATPDPKGALCLVIKEMFGADAADSGIDASAKVDPSATLGKGVSIGAGTVVGKGCELGPGVTVGPNCTIAYAVVGEGTRIGASVTIGNPGFGIVRDGGNTLAPHLGRVVIGARCYIASHCNIDRGFIKDTVIGDAVMIDTMVHIAHNVSVGDGCVLCGQVGIAGSARLGRNNVLGSKSGVADNVTVGDGNMFAALSGITNDVGDGQTMGGFPAVPIGEFRRQAVALRKLGRTNAKGGENG